MEVKAKEGVVNISGTAMDQIITVINQQEKDELFLRVYVQGGCGGIQYGMAIDSRFQEGDKEYLVGDLKVVIDRLSFPYVDGATVDFDDSGGKPGFRITNPNAADMMSAGGCSSGACGSCGPGGCC